MKSSTPNPKRSFDTCPRCQAPTAPAISFNNTPSEFWRECTYCNTFINTYIPMPHQSQFHKDPHRFRGNFGAYGSGKTLTSREEFYKHVFLTPGGNTLIGAKVVPQYEQTIKRDIENDIPRAFVSDSSVQRASMDFLNGHRLIFRPLDDQGKLRSLNLSMFIIVEASEVDADIFAQLKARLRSKTTEARQGIVESNPGAGWIRDDVLLTSSSITKHGTVDEAIAVLHQHQDPFTSSHITASDANYHLPPSFIEEVSANRPDWWVRRFIHGSFAYAEGLVYPRFSETLVPYFDPPKHWPRLAAFDYGLHNPSAFVFCAVDEENETVYVYKNIQTNENNVEELAQIYHEATKDIPAGGLLRPPLIDPVVGPKRDYNKKSLVDHFLDFGIYFRPGQVNLDARLYKVNTFIETGKLKVMDTCLPIIEESRNYKFPDQSLSRRNLTDKPVDKDNHSLDALGWILMDIPKKLSELYHIPQPSFSDNEQFNPRWLPHALRDTLEEEDTSPFTFDF